MQVQQLLQDLKFSTSSHSSSSTRSSSDAASQPSTQQHQQSTSDTSQEHSQHVSQLPWSQLCKLRASMNLQMLPPQQLVAGSEYIPSADGVNQNLLLLLHGLGDKPAAFSGEHITCVKLKPW